MAGDGTPTARGSGYVDRARSCRLCGLRLGTSWWENHLGDRFCLAHRDSPACLLCAAPMRNSATGRYCDACAATAICSTADLRAYLPTVRAGLHRMGVRLRTPIRVRIGTPAELDSAEGATAGTTFGVTHLLNGAATGITVCTGMPRMHFGSTVAHESMHVWIRQRDFPELPTAVEEGLCELTADEWLRRQPDPRAALVRQGMASSPDPVYGEGFRAARAALTGRRMGDLLRHVKRYGALP
ncbi:protein DA1 [Micromonospora zingiberis]|uniref:Protein DA1 n=1 Tax=Micromonospora zingiberis TaxID=2053011 RepID=A0A4R0GPH1_9ACTN|nr:protein DA1 [Micromonospora zingiberis]TCB99634.1 protein DA1 [Micromonospora zingiberis]